VVGSLFRWLGRGFLVLWLSCFSFIMACIM
jgi:hypothetical protein